MAMDHLPAQRVDAHNVADVVSQHRAMDHKIIDVESQNMVSPVGFKLNPTPSDDPDDPLNWSMWWKVGILTQTSLLAAIGGLNTAMINPALLQLAKEFHVDKVDASYQTTVCIALNGIAPWLWIPLAYKIGRRPIYLATTMLGLVTILSCAFTQTYTQLLIARIFNGFFPVGFALGATTVTDLFFYHQRGRAMGFFTVTVVNGSHLAPIFGGLIGQYCGWRWIFKFLAIVDAVLFVVAFFFLPETMYTRRRSSAATTAARLSATMQSSLSRSSDATLPNSSVTSALSTASTILPERPDHILKPRTGIQRYVYYLRLYTSNPDYKLDYVDTVATILRLFRSPTAVFPAIYYATMYGFASILPAVTAAVVFTEFFKWDTLTIGLAYGGALTTGGVLGEFLAGWVCDAVVKREQTRLQIKTGSTNDEDTKVPSEVRLRPLWTGALLTPVGLILYGFSLQYHTHPAVPLFGMGLSCFGLQIITTCTYTYAIDCHTNNMENNNTTTTTNNHQPPSSLSPTEQKSDTASSAVAQVAQLFNFIRQMFGFTYAFYALRLANKIGYQWTFLLFALCGGVLAFAPMVWLIFRRSNNNNHDNTNTSPPSKTTGPPAALQD